MKRNSASIDKMRGNEAYWESVRVHANMLTANTQPSSQPEMRGELYNNKNIMVKMFTRYGTQRNRMLNVIIKEMFQATVARSPEAVDRYEKALSYNLVLNSVVMASIGVGGKAFAELMKGVMGGEDDEEFKFEAEKKKAGLISDFGVEVANNVLTLPEGMDEAWAVLAALHAAAKGDKSADYMANRALMGKFVGSELKSLFDATSAMAEMRRVAQKEREEGITAGDAKWYAYNAEKAFKSVATAASFVFGVPLAGVEQALNVGRFVRKEEYGKMIDKVY
jgi:uncharacterized protein YaiI (UPF0178 family)